MMAVRWNWRASEPDAFEVRSVPARGAQIGVKADGHKSGRRESGLGARWSGTLVGREKSGDDPCPLAVGHRMVRQRRAPASFSFLPPPALFALLSSKPFRRCHSPPMKAGLCARPMPRPQIGDRKSWGPQESESQGAAIRVRLVLGLVCSAAILRWCLPVLGENPQTALRIAYTLTCSDVRFGKGYTNTDENVLRPRRILPRNICGLANTCRSTRTSLQLRSVCNTVDITSGYRRETSDPLIASQLICVSCCGKTSEKCRSRSGRPTCVIARALRLVKLH
ncbi:hypothetical protein C8R47DRAFT_428164 [Mycena vitilis]|nr:hypothetical protein C8R47DRAFT_428164 [Mycena vitilis]